MDGFLLKKFIGTMAMPLPIILIILTVGIVLLFTVRQKTAKWLLISGTVLLWLSSTPLLPKAVLEPLEQQFRQYDLSQPTQRIVVLGCGHTVDSRVPVTSQLKSCSLTRVIEAYRIWRVNPTATLYTSGYGAREAFSSARMNALLLEELGVPAEQIRQFDQARDTEDEARDLAEALGGEPFVLVTSASHMLRASRLFKQQGLHPVPAPTDHLVRREDHPGWLSHFPGARNIQMLERWWYERLGRSWQWIKTSLSI